jgi:hypothetical protein
MANISIEDLSLTISELIDLEPNQQKFPELSESELIAITGGQILGKNIFISESALALGLTIDPHPPLYILNNSLS